MRCEWGISPNKHPHSLTCRQMLSIYDNSSFSWWKRKGTLHNVFCTPFFLGALSDTTSERNKLFYTFLCVKKEPVRDGKRGGEGDRLMRRCASMTHKTCTQKSNEITWHTKTPFQWNHLAYKDTFLMKSLGMQRHLSLQ